MGRRILKKSLINITDAEVIRDKIIIRVNSQERGERVRGLIADFLGEEGVYQNTVMENMDHWVSSEASPSSQNPSLNDLPEIQEYLKEMSQKHWQGWLDESLPALDDITPREAVRTSRGKEKVEALFLMFEAHNARKPGDPMNADIPYLKKALGLS